MRHSVAAATCLIFVCSLASAKPKKGKAEKTPPEPPRPSMDSGDPALTETSDKGPFAPHGETGEAAETHAVEADAHEVVKARAHDRRVVFGNVLFGFGHTPAVGPNLPQYGSATSVTLMVGGHYDVTPQITAMLRIPWSTASVDSNGSKQNAQALGAPELGGEYRLQLSPLVRVPLEFGIGIPVAQGNPDPTTTDVGAQRQSVINAIADATSGYRDGELFGPKRLPIVLGARIEYERKALSLYGGTRFVFGFALNKTIQNPGLSAAGTYVAKGVALRNVTSAGVSYEILDKPELLLGLDTWLAYKAIDAIQFESSATPPTKLQFVFEPRVGARFGKFRPSLGYVLPIGGRLGDGSIKALELHADVVF